MTPTIVSLRMIMRFPDEHDPEKTNSYTFRHLALDADDDRILDLSDAIRSLLYDPAVPVETSKRITTDLAVV